MPNYYIYRHAWRFRDAHHRETELSKNEVNHLFSNGGWLIRNTYEFDTIEKSEFWYLIKDSFNGMEEHTSKGRNKIRKALKTYDYRIIDTNLLKEKGFDIYKEVLKNYPIKDRHISYNSYLSIFNNNCECWGCFKKNTDEIIGFAINYIWDDSCQYEITAILPPYKHNTTYPYYGLIYIMDQYYLEEKKYKYVSDGSRSISEHSNFQEFLIRNFKFRKAYCRLKIYYKWWLNVVIKVLFPFRNMLTSNKIRAILRMHEYFCSFQ